MKILYLLPTLAYGGAARQVLTLARGLVGRCDLRVCMTHADGPWAEPLRAAGVPVDSLQWTRPLDPLPLWRLHRLLRDFQPDCVHVWRWPALRLLALVNGRYLSRTIVSQVLPVDQAQPSLGRVERWLLGRVAKIIAGGEAEAQRLRHLHIAPGQVAVVPPGTELFNIPLPPPVPTRCVVCVGNLRPCKGFRQALRAADYLAYSFDDVRLDIIGTGQGLPSLQRFRETIYHRNHTHFVGAAADAANCLARADVCWVPSLTATGRQVALEAMAAGRPVIASDLPHLREIITDGVNGLLFPPGEETALAQRTRQVFLDDALRLRLGEAARQHVCVHFAAADFIERMGTLYGVRPLVKRAAG